VLFTHLTQIQSTPGQAGLISQPRFNVQQFNIKAQSQTETTQSISEIRNNVLSKEKLRIDKKIKLASIKPNFNKKYYE
jgi:hypothetical protein